MMPSEAGWSGSGKVCGMRLERGYAIAHRLAWIAAETYRDVPETILVKPGPA